MKKCCFIIPYFGKFPNYFQLFLNSCRYNPGFNWLIFTDDHTKFNYPENVKVVYMLYDNFKRAVQSRFDFPLAIPTPHKLCDFKPAYGYLFEEYLEEFKFWGYCDLDLIMGCLEDFLTDDLLESYDKIFCLGHMTLYRNTHENNRVFMRKYKGLELYKLSFSSGKTTTFDEEWRDEYNVNRIFLAEGKRVFTEDYSMNPSIFHNKFIRVKYVGVDLPNDGHGYITEQPKDALYVWEKGKVSRYYMDGKEFKSEKFIYMHLQMRKMKVDNRVFYTQTFKIFPNKFLPLEVNYVDASNFHQIKRSCICFMTQKKRWKVFKKRIKSHFKL